MTDRYVKDILEKLEEIEKLHSKLRSLVPRMKNHPEAGSAAANVAHRYANQVSVTEAKDNAKNSWERKLSANRVDSGGLRSSRGSRYLKKLRSNSVNFVSGQWNDKKDKIKGFLADLFERDVILVTRAAQTTDSLVDGPMTSRKQSSTRNQNGRIGKNGFSWAQKRQIRKKRRSSGQGLLERILEQFNYTHDSDLSNEDRVSIRDHPLGSQVPHRAQKLLLLPDDETETLGIISNAKRVSVDDNEIYSSSDRRIHRFARRYSGDH